MRGRLKSKIVLVMAVVMACAAQGFAQDWPQWRGANQDGSVSGFKAPEVWPAKLTPKWQVTVGEGVATPALVDGKLYVFSRQGGDEVITCLNAATGDKVWSDQYAVAPIDRGPAMKYNGPRCSPAVGEGKVVTVGMRSMISCLDAASGKVLWRKDPYEGAVPQFFTGASPMIAGGMAIAFLGGAGKGGIVAYGLDSGEERWKWEGAGPDYGSPVKMTVDGVDQIVTLTEKSVVGVGAAAGKLLWEIPFEIQRMSMNSTTPIVNGQSVIFTASGRGTHAVKIERDGDGFAAKPQWDNNGVATKFNTPTLRDGMLYGFTGRGNLFCLNAETGETVWVDENSLDRMGFAAMLSAGPVMLALPPTAELIAFKPGEKSLDEVGHVKLSDTATYAHPVISGKNVYVKDDQTISLRTF